MMRFIAGFGFALTSMSMYSALSQSNTVIVPEFGFDSVVVFAARSKDGERHVIQVDEKGYVICSETRP